jgi:hypothetical protein
LPARPARQRLIPGSCPSARSFAPRFLSTLSHPHAVALRFVRRDQLTAGLSPARVRPCWAHKGADSAARPSGGILTSRAGLIALFQHCISPSHARCLAVREALEDVRDIDLAGTEVVKGSGSPPPARAAQGPQGLRQRMDASIKRSEAGRLRPASSIPTPFLANARNRTLSCRTAAKSGFRNAPQPAPRTPFPAPARLLASRIATDSRRASPCLHRSRKTRGRAARRTAAPAESPSQQEYSLHTMPRSHANHAITAVEFAEDLEFSLPKKIHGVRLEGSAFYQCTICQPNIYCSGFRSISLTAGHCQKSIP